MTTRHKNILTECFHCTRVESFRFDLFHSLAGFLYYCLVLMRLLGFFLTLFLTHLIAFIFL